MALTVYYGAVVNPISLDTYDALSQCALGVNSDGVIDWVEQHVPSSSLQETMVKHGYLDAEVIDLNSGFFLLPGLVDTHIVSGIFSAFQCYFVNNTSSMHHNYRTPEGNDHLFIKSMS